MGKIKQIKTRIEERLMELYSKIGINGKPLNHKDVVTFMMNGVMEIASIENDIDKRFDKWMENKELIGLYNNMQVVVKVLKPDFGKLDTGMLPDNTCTHGLHIPPFARTATPDITGFNPHVVENIWSEIRNNYEEDGVVFIDAWEDENDDSDGRIIAKVDATGKVEYVDPRAVNDTFAQEIIRLTVKDVLMRDMTELTYSCDMGSLKIGTGDMSMFINNGYGDGRFKVRINLNKVEPSNDMHFEGHFTVRTSGSVHVFRHDCSTDAIYTFTKTGRYFCYTDNGIIYITWNDDCVVS